MPQAAAELLAAMRRIHQYLIMSAPTGGQSAALLRALTDPAAEDAVQEMVASYGERRRFLVDGLNEIGLDCFEPKGAFYAFPSVQRTGMGEFEFADKLLNEERVAVIPGSGFGAGGEGHVRCAYPVEMPKLEIALERMYRFLRRHGV